jgi:hypothetical protein
VGHSDLAKSDKILERSQGSCLQKAFSHRKDGLFFSFTILVIATCILAIGLPVFGLEERKSSDEAYLKGLDQVRGRQATLEVLAQPLQLKVQAFGEGQTFINGIGNNTLLSKVVPSRLDFELRELGDNQIARNVTSLISVYDEGKERVGMLVFRDLLSTRYGVFNLIMYDQKTNSSSVIDDQDPIFFRLWADNGSTHVVSNSSPVKIGGNYRVEVEIYKAEIEGNMTKSAVQEHLPITITYYWDGKGALSKMPLTPVASDVQLPTGLDMVVVIGCIAGLTVLAASTHINWKSLPSIFHPRPKERQEVADAEKARERLQYRRVEIPQIGIGADRPTKTFTELYKELAELGLNTEVLKRTDLSECELEDLCYAMRQLQMAYETVQERESKA